MCSYCKPTNKPVDLIEIFGRSNPNCRTGVDLHNGDPVFMFCGGEVAYTKHAVGYDWMMRQLPESAMNKMLYFIDSGCSESESDVAASAPLFGAVYDSYAYLFILKLDEA
jgi:hypothetical protein